MVALLRDLREQVSDQSKSRIDSMLASVSAKSMLEMKILMVLGGGRCGRCGECGQHARDA
jgi:hypothetical protein